MNAPYESQLTQEIPTVAPDPDDGDPTTEGTDEPRTHTRRWVWRKWMTKGSVSLGALVIVLAGFLGGAYAQQHWGSGKASTTGALPNGLAGGAPGGFSLPSGATGSGPSAQASTANTVTGTVTRVDGNTVYIKKADGTVVTVKVSDATAIQLAQGSSLSGLPAGSSVTVTGQSASDGSVDASAITKTK